MSGIRLTPKYSVVIEKCPDVCARAYYYADPVFEGRGQWNCPHRFGVTHAAAIIDGRVNCKHFKAKDETKQTRRKGVSDVRVLQDGTE